MGKAIVTIAAAALAVLPTAAHAADGPRYGTEDCYVVVNMPPSITVSTEPPFVHIGYGPPIVEEVHCPIS